MTTPKPLPTYYKGHVFRSRLEARWAIVFDHLAIPWEYEKEAYKLPSGNYLPDFWLPTIRGGMWFEVKGQEPTGHETNLAFELAKTTGADVAVAFGAIPADGEDSDYDSAHMHFAPDEWSEDGWDCCYHFQSCPTCGTVGFEFEDYVGRLPCRCSYQGHEQGVSHVKVYNALEAGRTARFDNGHYNPNPSPARKWRK